MLDVVRNTNVLIGTGIVLAIALPWYVAVGITTEGVWLREFLLEHTKVPMAEMRKVGGIAWIELASTEIARKSIELDPWPISSKASNIGLVVAGGAHSTHALWMQGYSPAVIGREIKLPAVFEQLVAEADSARASAMPA